MNLRINKRAGFAPIVIIIVAAVAAITGLAGGIALYYNGKLAEEIKETNPAPSAVNFQNTDTAGWQTYRNEEYGFEIKYPLNFKETEYINPANIFSLDLGYDNTPYIGDISIRVYKNYENQTIAEYFAAKKIADREAYISRCQTCAVSDVDAEFDECMLSRAEKIEVGGRDAYMCSRMPERMRRFSPIFIFHSGYIYELSGFNESSQYREYNQILSTFKFIESADVSIWKSGILEKISKRDSKYYLTIRAVQFVSDPKQPNNYRINDLNKIREFPLSSVATINIIGDTLAILISSGVVEDDLNNPRLSKTILFSDFAKAFEIKGYSWDKAILINELYNFSFADGVVTKIEQQYLP